MLLKQSRLSSSPKENLPCHERGRGLFFSHFISLKFRFALSGLFHWQHYRALKFAIIRLHENDYFSRVKSNKFRLADYCSNRLVRIR